AVGAGPGRKWLVLGDMRELGPTADELHARSGHEARAAGFERLYTLGEHSRAAAAAFDGGDRHYPSVDALIAELTDDLLLSGGEPPVVLVKGSRGMRMERVVAALAAPGELVANLEGHG
ncbi:MAG: UDP-N-acetylmuramoylalanyl-D-glutamyl-2, 6-diaminopimelate--D-alanyl-D-alanine ligase, partial [Candidatus Competibacter sp.]|nr:UDP-N-acetylmuramoylalanyl-D-glutamyl-2, 6-diaminopimelate--D-alanyl-D-alanine ligase [Candidatus Competibacter sp.]